MKNKLFLIATIVFLVACKQSKETKNELNFISFKVAKDVMIDSLKTATELLDKMDNGNGATCSVRDGKLHYTRKEPGFSIVDIPVENSTSVPVVEPLNQENSIRLFNLLSFLTNNGIDGMVKRYDGFYWFSYKQIVFNPYNNSNEFRDIVYLKEPKDTCSKYFNKLVILDRYKNILLRAPKNYNEPKLPMDSASIMKRTYDDIKKSKEEKR